MPTTKEGSVSAANEWWRNKQKEIDTAPEAPIVIEDFYAKQKRFVAEWLRQQGQDEEAKRVASQGKEEFKQWWDNLVEYPEPLPAMLKEGEEPEEFQREESTVITYEEEETRRRQESGLTVSRICKQGQRL